MTELCKQCTSTYVCTGRRSCRLAESQAQVYASQAQQRSINNQAIGNDYGVHESAQHLRIAELEERIKQLEKLVHYPYLAGKEQVERITKLEAEVAREKSEEHLYAPLRSDAGALLAMATLLRRMANSPYSYAAAHDWQNEARLILEKYSK